MTQIVLFITKAETRNVEVAAATVAIVTTGDNCPSR